MACDSRHIIEMANDCDQRLRQGTPDVSEKSRLLTELMDHVRDHFAEQDLYMKGLAYPDADSHARAHAALNDQIVEIVQMARSFGLTPEVAARQIRQLLRAHTQGADAKLAYFKQATRGSGAT